MDTKGQYAGLKFPITLGSDACVEYKNKEYIINPGFNWGSNEKFQSKEFNILGLPLDGCFAEEVAVEEGYLYPKPEHLSTSEAAALPLAGLTAYRALFLGLIFNQMKNINHRNWRWRRTVWITISRCKWIGSLCYI